MRTQLIATWTILAITAVSAEAHAAASKKENIGVGAGAVVGAAAGGPVGFIIGAAIGAKLGDSANKRDQEIEQLESTLDGSRSQVATLESDVDDLNSEIDQLSRVARPQLLSLMQAGIDMDLLFRTDEFVLADTTSERLNAMATSLAGMPEIQVQLDGFADERGAADYNLALSGKRVEFVRNLLINAGVHPTRISTSAHGESVAQDTNIDSLALERRVSVKLFVDSPHSLAANPVSPQ